MTGRGCSCAGSRVGGVGCRWLTVDDEERGSK